MNTPQKQPKQPPGQNRKENDPKTNKKDAGFHVEANRNKKEDRDSRDNSYSRE